MLEFEQVQVGDSVDYCIIWLHGLGADGHDFVPVIPELQLPESPGIKFIFPHAPSQPITVNGGYVMRAWYDIAGPDITSRQDRQGIEQSTRLVGELIAAQNAAGITDSRIILAGFSQGGAIALHVGLRSGHRFAGIMALSTYLPLAEELPLDAASDDSASIFMAHGSHDSIVPITAGMASKRLLNDKGYSVEWHDYPMEHAVCMEEIQDISRWLQTITANDQQFSSS